MYIGKVSLKYQIVDHYAGSLNYKKPFIKYFYQVTSAIAYTASILTLVSFGVVLYVSDKVKEKEESYVEPIVDDEEKELEQLEKESANE